MKNLFVILSILFLFIGCSDKEKERITVVTNSWIGYAPLFYAKEKNYLKDLNIKLVTAVSLGEASEIYSVGKADMVTTTQHEYYALKQMFKTLVPVILLDRSNGGDMILSNKTIEELRKSDKIYVYLEVDSINREMIEIFTNINHIDEKKFVFINGDQAQLQSENYDLSKPIILATYTPYNNFYLKRGFHEIASTGDLDDIVIIDALCTTKEFLNRNISRLEKFKKIIDQSIAEIEGDKKGSYKLIKRYLNDISYSEYLDSLKSIKWINNPEKELLDKIDKLGYKKEYIIQ